MTLSVALCTFNGESYLFDQLESIARQTRLPDELVVCDDRSEDGTFAVIDRFAHRVGFITNMRSACNEIWATAHCNTAELKGRVPLAGALARQCFSTPLTARPLSGRFALHRHCRGRLLDNGSPTNVLPRLLAPVENAPFGRLDRVERGLRPVLRELEPDQLVPAAVDGLPVEVVQAVKALVGPPGRAG